MLILLFILLFVFVAMLNQKLHDSDSAVSRVHLMGDCQNYGSFLGPLHNTAPNIWGTGLG